MMTEDYSEWIGRQQTTEDVATLAPLQCLSATLDEGRGFVDGIVPPLWHWLYFLPKAHTAELGIDGHPPKGDFLPPISLPRRMWAGSQVRFERPIRCGEKLKRVTTIADVVVKSGKTGSLVFLKLAHEIHASGEIAVIEWQDIVYREGSKPGAPKPAAVQAPDVADLQRVIEPSSVLLFRYSALTFNSHRIHYDRPYAMHEEGYEGLVVHGPLLATLLVGLAQQAMPNKAIKTFSFRAVMPVFDTSTFAIQCLASSESTVDVWAATRAGALAVQANATFQ
jgi:3-methylfumaryl-CoA hydratase